MRLAALALAFFLSTSVLEGALKHGDAAPPIEITKWLRGEAVDLQKAREKKVVVVEFWATWCPPCRTSIPHLTELQKKYKKDLGAPKLAGESEYTVLERVWARPTFEVNGLLGGFTGEGAKTVIPAVSMAKVSMRLVPDQHPDKIAKLFEDYVSKVAPKTVELKVTRMHGGKPWITGFDNPYVRAAGRAIEQGFGKAPVFCREGGSIPVVSTFQEELGVPAVLFGVGLPDENAHAPNERLDLGNFHNGIVASAILYKEIAGTKA